MSDIKKKKAMSGKKLGVKVADKLTTINALHGFTLRGFHEAGGKYENKELMTGSTNILSAIFHQKPRDPFWSASLDDLREMEGADLETVLMSNFGNLRSVKRPSGKVTHYIDKKSEHVFLHFVPIFIKALSKDLKPGQTILDNKAFCGNPVRHIDNYEQEWKAQSAANEKETDPGMEMTPDDYLPGLSPLEIPAVIPKRTVEQASLDDRLNKFLEKNLGRLIRAAKNNDYDRVQVLSEQGKDIHKSLERLGERRRLLLEAELQADAKLERYSRRRRREKARE